MDNKTFGSLGRLDHPVFEDDVIEVDEDYNDPELFAYKDSNDVAHYYKDKWEKIEDNHYPECMMAIAAKEKRLSTACQCREIRIAEETILDEARGE